MKKLGRHGGVCSIPAIVVVSGVALSFSQGGKAMLRGLIVKEEPLNKILSSVKTWEMRSSAVGITGTIALIQSKSGKVVGTAELVRCLGPLSRQELSQARGQHQASDETLEQNFGYQEGRVYAWELRNARRLPRPVRYKHPSGAVIWVNLDDIESKVRAM